MMDLTLRILVPVLCLLAAPLAANPFDGDPVDWTGHGIFRRAIDAETESMRCRSRTNPVV